MWSSILKMFKQSLIILGTIFFLCSWFRASQVYIINVQRDATICSLYFILLKDQSTRFGCLSHPSSGVHKTVVTATGKVIL